LKGRLNGEDIVGGRLISMGKLLPVSWRAFN